MSVLRHEREHGVAAALLSLALLSACLAGCGGRAKGSDTAGAQLSAEMLRLTQEATARLGVLAKANLPEDRVFEEVKAVTEFHARAMAALGARFNALPSSSRQAFLRSPEGSAHERRLNEELKTLKALALALVQDVAGVPLDLGIHPAESTTTLLAGPRAWPTETKEAIEAKHGFIQMFLQGVANYGDAQRAVLLSKLDSLQARALDGDVVAVAELNGLLKEVVAMYPKDDPAAQFNLGVLYSEIGEPAEAKKWLAKAAAQGLPQASVELNRLRKRK